MNYLKNKSIGYTLHYATRMTMVILQERIKDRVKSFAVNTKNCVECGLCIKQCHERAIQFV